MKKKLLLLSSSRVDDSGYLTQALTHIESFVAHRRDKQAESDSIASADDCLDCLFIPYAGVSIDFDSYTEMVQSALLSIKIKLTSIHGVKNKQQAIKKANVILVGGGNTFCLLNRLYQFDLMQSLVDAINQGVPYIGWSAGSNIVSPSISTTNDMPIVEPPSFKALGFIDAQINPHFVEANPAGHNGETRQQRLEEYLTLNPSQKIIALPEGTGIRLDKSKLYYFGDKQAFMFDTKVDGAVRKTALNDNQDLNALLKPSF